MTIQRARELLGEEIKEMSDRDIQQMIDNDYLFCDSLLEVIMNTKNDSLTLKETTN